MVRATAKLSLNGGLTNGGHYTLEHAKLSIKKLQKLFGIIPRIRKKHRKNKGDEENKSSTDDKEKEDEGGTGTASNHQSSVIKAD